MPDPATTPSSRPRLVVVAGPLEGEVFAVDRDPYTVGRHSSNVLQLHQDSVSRRHLELRCAGDGCRVDDLGSRCGTFVNGHRLEDSRTLEHGDYLKVGDTVFLYLAPGRRHPQAGDPAAELGSTVELSIEDAFFLRPDQIRASLEDRDRIALQLSMLLRLSTEVQAPQAPEQLVARLAELIFELLPADRVAILLGDASEPQLEHRVRRDGGEESWPISRTLAERVERRDVAVLSNDLAADQLAGVESLDTGRIASVLCVPLRVRERSIGLLYADGSRSSFDRDHLELLSAAAAIAAMAIDQAQRLAWLEAENRRLRAAELEHDIVGQSAAIERVLKLLGRVAPTDLTVLVLGESGTGKELIAGAIHRNSPRAEQPFVAINCATLSDTLLESELFGHEKGSFTGAVGRKIGQFELAHGGTLFLDEVGEIPVGLQARLLRALENRQIQRVGGARTIPVDVRIVAATNRDLERGIAEGTFREDLYHRLNVFSLELPPLRRRREDIPLLADHFAARSARRLGRPVRGLSPEARRAVTAYDWPGNVRELQNAMERAVVLAADDWLRPEDLPDAVLESAAGSGDPETYHEAVAEAKRRILRAAIDAADGSYSEAAKRLGLNRTYLHRLLSQLKLRPEFKA